MASSRKYTATELEKKIDEFFESKKEDSVPPLWEECLLHLGITRNTWNSYGEPTLRDNMSEEEKVDKLNASDIIKKAQLRFTANMARYGFTNPNKMTYVIYMLKQMQYGGYTDKQEIEHKDLKIDVKINGIAGNPFG